MSVSVLMARLELGLSWDLVLVGILHCQGRFLLYALSSGNGLQLLYAAVWLKARTLDSQ